MPADFAVLLLLLWPCCAQKAYLARVTDHIKAISCSECVILAQTVNEVVVHICVCVYARVCVVVRSL